MTNIKTTLTSLSNFFNSLFNSDLLKPEYFKFAKFNNDENVVSIFWTLLHKMSQNRDQQMHIHENIKIFLASHNYRNLQFYSLPNHSNKQSRELLLALAYLIGNTDILSNLIKTKIAKSIISQEFQKIDSKPQNPINNTPYDCFEHLYNYLLLLIGKIDKNIKLAMEFDEQTINITTIIHKDLNNAKQLTIAELNHLKQPEHLKSYLKEIKNVSDMLEHYFMWRKHEALFWDWMVSVFELKTDHFVDLDNLKLFLKYFRSFMKDLLTQTVDLKSDVKQTNIRRVYLQNVHESVASDYKCRENRLKELEIDVNANLEHICAFLQQIIKDE